MASKSLESLGNVDNGYVLIESGLKIVFKTGKMWIMNVLIENGLKIVARLGNMWIMDT